MDREFGSTTNKTDRSWLFWRARRTMALVASEWTSFLIGQAWTTNYTGFHPLRGPCLFARCIDIKRIIESFPPIRTRNTLRRFLKRFRIFESRLPGGSVKFHTFRRRETLSLDPVKFDLRFFDLSFEYRIAFVVDFFVNKENVRPMPLRSSDCTGRSRYNSGRLSFRQNLPSNRLPSSFAK